VKTTRHSSLDRKLYENLFLNRSPEEIFHLLSDGILAFIANAERLYNDAQLLFKQGRWASGRFLLTTANEEMAKPYIFIDTCRVDFSRHQSILVRLCYAFYDHKYKFAYNNVLNNLKITNMQNAKDEWLESVERWIPYSEKEDAEPIHETYFLREMPLYIDFLDHDQRWSTPEEDIAEYNYSMGGGILDSESAINLLKKTQESGLFSSGILKLINKNFKKHYFSETTSNDLLVELHKKTAKQIETKWGISEIIYQESSLRAIPLYHFLTVQK
jgi:AbiV family abortive infection protein